MKATKNIFLVTHLCQGLHGDNKAIYLELPTPCFFHYTGQDSISPQMSLTNAFVSMKKCWILLVPDVLKLNIINM